MTSRDFCFWLQGCLELGGGEGGLNAKQVQLIRRHLDLVFKHEIDPSQGDAKHQAELNAIHDGRPLPGEASLPMFAPPDKYGNQPRC